MARILLAEDDDTLRNALVIALSSAGHDAAACPDGAAALEEFGRHRPDLVVLDVMMPRKSGYDVCREIRGMDADVPILFLTAKAEEEDVVLGLGLGADDFISKPFRMGELLARIAAALRRAAKNGAVRVDDVFFIGKAKIDAKKFIAEADGVSHILTVRELDLLRELAAHRGEVVSRADLLDEVWGLDYDGGTRTVDQHVLQVRKKLGSSGDMIESIRGIGYRVSQ